MWAQLIKSRAKPGKEEEIRNLPQEFEAQGSSMPMMQVFTCSNQKDPSEYYTLIVFENEAAARQSEASPEAAARVKRMMELFEGPPEYVDLNVEYHRSR